MWIYQPDDLRSRCKGCNAEIRWAVTERLAKVPLDIGFFSTDRRLDQNGVEQHEVSVEFSHFKTCTMRDRFSAAKKAA